MDRSGLRSRADLVNTGHFAVKRHCARSRVTKPSSHATSTAIRVATREPTDLVCYARVAMATQRTKKKTRTAKTQTRKTPPTGAETIRLDDEEAVRDVLVETVQSLWEVVNGLTRL